MNYYNVPMGKIDQNPYKNIKVTKANKSFLIDEKNKRYIDLCSGLWNCSFGYNSELNDLLLSKLKEILNSGVLFLDIHSYTHDVYEIYAKELLEFCNESKYNFNKLSYTNSGSECTELALKYIKHINGNKKILCFDKGYHGTYFGGMNVSGIDNKTTSIYNSTAIDIEFLSIPKNKCEEDKIIKYIEANKENLGGFILEPVIGSSGVFPLNISFLNKLLKVLKKYNIVSVFDEVATGFYRTGRRFYFHLLEYSPDILLLSKGINNGILPFGTVLLSKNISNLLIENNAYIEHFSTQNGNILTIQLALIVLNYIKKKENELLKNIKEIESIINLEFSDSKFIIHGLGGMYSININNSQYLDKLILNLINNGILVYNFWNSNYDNGLTIFPILFMDVKLLKKSLSIIKKQLEIIVNE
ncbi:aminotransferase class III-fold pyridoxal phosphate-dependent enzyme [Clostridium perfringens]|uniref:aminotransferase class III-fold pyridoxal phosphate-dependent enzyme n=1 Tax=Clostridium perfringens TaxID=1502 RepID=UPI002FCD4BEC